MGRKPVLEGGKRDEIIEAALQLFFEKGYEGTSVRMIQKKVGSEIGLFYYYFKSKDEVFDIAINRYMLKYHELYQSFIDNNKQNAENLLYLFFGAVKKAVSDFRSDYADNLHWSVRRAIREQGLEMLCPYVEQCIDIMSDSGVKFADVSENTMAVALAYGIGGAIIQHSEDITIEELESVLARFIR